MISRNLVALNYPLREEFNINDQKSIRLLIIWLERTYLKSNFPTESEAYKQFSNAESPQWDISFQKYMTHCCGIPNQISATDVSEVISWLLSLAVGEKHRRSREETSDQTHSAKPNGSLDQRPTTTAPNSSALDNLNFGSPEFVEGVRDLANILAISNHPNHLVTLEAIATLVKNRMSNNALKMIEDLKSKGEPWPIKEAEADMGFESGDYVSNEASRVLRLLYIHDLRDLQTKINECIVAIQKISANPKTDARLGKIGC